MSFSQKLLTGSSQALLKGALLGLVLLSSTACAVVVPEPGPPARAYYTYPEYPPYYYGYAAGPTFVFGGLGHGGYYGGRRGGRHH